MPRLFGMRFIANYELHESPMGSKNLKICQHTHFDDLLETLQLKLSVPCGTDGKHLCLVQGHGSEGNSSDGLSR